MNHSLHVLFRDEQAFSQDLVAVGVHRGSEVDLLHDFVEKGFFFGGFGWDGSCGRGGVGLFVVLFDVLFAFVFGIFIKCCL